MSKTTLSTATPNAGDPVQVGVTVTNTSIAEATNDVLLFINGDVEFTFADVTMAGEGSVRLTREVSRTVAGPYAVQVGTEPAVFVIAAAQIQVDNLQVDPRVAAAGSP